MGACNNLDSSMAFFKKKDQLQKDTYSMISLTGLSINDKMIEIKHRSVVAKSKDGRWSKE